MIKAGKINSIRIVRWWLDFILLAGGIFTVSVFLASTGARLMGSEYTTMAQWPVKIIFGDSNSLALTMIDIHKAVGNQILIEAIPARTILRLTGLKSIAMIGFDFAWILVSYGTALMIIYLMRKIFRHMESGEFFDHKTPKRLRMIGWTIIGASVFRSVFTYLFGYYISALMNGIPPNAKATVLNPLGKPVPVFMTPLTLFSYEQILFGFIILALAIAFQKGLDLKLEQSLTV